jgi:hypothetical protein
MIEVKLRDTLTQMSLKLGEGTGLVRHGQERSPKGGSLD